MDASQYGFGLRPSKAPYKQNQFGATFGGPIKKDKAFFFVDYEGTRIHQAQSDIVTVPTDGTNGTSNERAGDFSGILGGQSMICGANGASACVDALNRPIYTNEVYDPSTTRTLSNGSVVRNGFGFNPNTGLPIAGQANIVPTASLKSLGPNYAALYPAPNQAGPNGDYSTSTMR